MANAKFIDAATWASLPEIDVTNGEDLFPQLAAGTYRPVLSGVDSAVIPALTAGAIVQATPTVGDTLTVSGSNATGSATFQWQRDTGGGQADISGATSATYDTTGQPEGDYRRGVSDGVQGPVYTAAVTLGAAATVPGTMSAPTVTAVSDTEISVDRAAAPSDGGSAILSYELRWQPDGGSWTIVEMTTDPQTVTGLTASTLYNVQTRAVNAIGPCPTWSASGSATTDAASSVFYLDDFKGRTVGDTITDDANWSQVFANNSYPIKVRSFGGGQAAARQVDGLGATGYEQVGFVGGGIPASRKVSFDYLQGRNGVAGAIFRLAAAYLDENNFMMVIFETSGNFNTTLRSGGVSSPNNIATPTLNAGDNVSLEWNNSTGQLISRINGTPIFTSPTGLTAPTLLNPGYGLWGSGSATYHPHIDNFKIEAL